MTRLKLFAFVSLSLLISLATTVVLSAPAPKDDPLPDGAIAVEPATVTEEEATEHLKTSTNNLKQIALAVHNFVATIGHLPHDIVDDKGKAILSWRVSLLAYFEQGELYKKFRFDEPWDGENNKKFLEEMPEIYASPRVVVKKKGYTVYQCFAGKGTPFEPGEILRFTDVTDGTSNTIMFVESSAAVPWTKPADLPFDVKKDLPNIGKAYGDKPLAALCDGSVRVLNLKTLKPETLKAAITIAGGEVLGPDW